MAAEAATASCQDGELASATMASPVLHDAWSFVVESFTTAWIVVWNVPRDQDQSQSEMCLENWEPIIIDPPVLVVFLPDDLPIFMA